jgi:hypothetical protein
MKLPPEPDCSDAILQYLTEQVVNNKDLHKPNDATWMLADHFCKLHQTRYFSAKNIQQSFTSMVPGGVRAFYVKAQNAVLMMYRLSLDPSLVEVLHGQHSCHQIIFSEQSKSHSGTAFPNRL